MQQVQDYRAFNELLELLAFPGEIQEAVRAYYVKNSNRVREQAELAYEGELPDFPLCRRKPFTRLVVVIYKLIEAKKKYQSLAIPDTVFQNTISDVSLRVQLYREKTNSIGLDKDSVIWFRHIFKAQIFKIGALQFQLFRMLYLDEESLGEPYMTFPQEWKVELPEDTPVINVHIQQSADLTPKAVSESFQMAGEFFSKHFPEHKYQAFICYSWLLYPGLKKLLPDDSNILQFADRFTLIGAVQDNEDAIQRIYGHHYRAKRDYKRDTSLQRKAVNKLNLLGEGCGIIWR